MSLASHVRFKLPLLNDFNISPIEILAAPYLTWMWVAWVNNSLHGGQIRIRTRTIATGSHFQFVLLHFVCWRVSCFRCGSCVSILCLQTVIQLMFPNQVNSGAVFVKYQLRKKTVVVMCWLLMCWLLSVDVLSVDVLHVLHVLDLAALSWRPFLSLCCTQLYRLKCLCFF